MTSLSNKYGITKEEAQKMIDRIVRMAKAVGLEYDYDKLIQTNTFDAHKLVQYGKEINKDNKLIERLFKAYFIDGLDIGDMEVLQDLGEEVGLHRDKVLNVLNSQEYALKVEEDKELAQKLEISSVPFFVIDNKTAIPGAQPPETFIELIKEINKKKLISKKRY